MKRGKWLGANRAMAGQNQFAQLELPEDVDIPHAPQQQRQQHRRRHQREQPGRRIQCAAIYRSRLMLVLHERSLNRSEEHTSELQSLMRISYAVFCLKKKKQIYYIHQM